MPVPIELVLPLRAVKAATLSSFLELRRGQAFTAGELAQRGFVADDVYLLGATMQPICTRDIETGELVQYPVGTQLYGVA